MADKAVDYDGLLFAAKPSARQNNKFGTAKLAVEPEQLIGYEEFEFEWQRDNKVPSRKQLLCLALKRLTKSRLQHSYSQIENMAEKFAGEWCDLNSMGEEAFSAENQEVELIKYEKRLIKRRVLLKIQHNLGQKSIINAFSQWKEQTVLLVKRQRAKMLANEQREQSVLEQKIGIQLKNELRSLQDKLAVKQKEFKRYERHLATKLDRYSLKSKTSRHRLKAFGIYMRVILARHKSRVQTHVMNRWYQHSKLIEIHNLYKKDMIANQEEFVYVTWQERERHKAAMEYLERSKRRALIMKSAKELEKKKMSLNKDKVRDSDDLQQQYSFDPKKLSQPKTIPFERIQRTIIKLQQKFRASQSERNSEASYSKDEESLDHQDRVNDLRDTAKFYRSTTSPQNNNTPSLSYAAAK